MSIEQIAENFKNHIKIKNGVRIGELIFDSVVVDEEHREDMIISYGDIFELVVWNFFDKEHIAPHDSVVKSCLQWVSSQLAGKSEESKYLSNYDPTSELQDQHTLVYLSFLSSQPNELLVATRVLIRKPKSDMFEVARARKIWSNID